VKKYKSISKHPADIFKHLVLLILAALLTSDLTSQTWTGNTNTDWNTSTNWNPASVPTETSNVVIPGAVSSGNWPVFGSNVTINSINMQPGSQLDVNGFTFTLNGQQAYIWILGATLNNSSSGTDIIINLCTGPVGWADYLRSLTVNDDVIFNLSGSSLLIEGDQSPPCQY